MDSSVRLSSNLLSSIVMTNSQREQVLASPYVGAKWKNFCKYSNSKIVNVSLKYTFEWISWKFNVLYHRFSAQLKLSAQNIGIQFLAQEEENGIAISVDEIITFLTDARWQLLANVFHDLQSKSD